MDCASEICLRASDQLTENQAELLEQIAKTQVERLDAINKSLENEKTALSETAAAPLQFRRNCGLLHPA